MNTNTGRHASAHRIRRGILRDLDRRSRTAASHGERLAAGRTRHLARRLHATPDFWLTVNSRDLEHAATKAIRP